MGPHKQAELARHVLAGVPALFSPYVAQLPTCDELRWSGRRAHQVVASFGGETYTRFSMCTDSAKKCSIMVVGRPSRRQYACGRWRLALEACRCRYRFLCLSALQRTKGMGWGMPCSSLSYVLSEVSTKDFFFGIGKCLVLRDAWLACGVAARHSHSDTLARVHREANVGLGVVHPHTDTGRRASGFPTLKGVRECFSFRDTVSDDSEMDCGWNEDRRTDVETTQARRERNDLWYCERRFRTSTFLSCSSKLSRSSHECAVDS
mmetsp:Transcript_32457/g.103532  ORF Transcript_32457/g.103532 Transcript_32457/m.103532 type:complete len:263 (+) Transcript_32457:1134-1922(+)